jgi:hypothetical protein
MVALAQPEGDASSGAGRAPEPLVVRLWLQTPGPCVTQVELRAPRWAQPKSWARPNLAKQTTKERHGCGGLTAQCGGLTSSLCTGGDLTAGLAV